jgi:hypothetical protein
LASRINGGQIALLIFGDIGKGVINISTAI